MKKLICILLIFTLAFKSFNSDSPLLDKSKPVKVTVKSNYAKDSLENVITAWLQNIGYKVMSQEEISAEIKSGVHVNRNQVEQDFKNARDAEDMKKKIKDRFTDDRLAWFTTTSFYFNFYYDSSNNQIKLDSLSVKLLPSPNRDYKNEEKYPKISLNKDLLSQKSITFSMAKIVDSITSKRK